MSRFNFDKVRNNLEQVKRELPALLADDAQQYFSAAFANQGWEGAHWAEVQRRTEGTKAYKYPRDKGLSRRTLPILQRTGTLEQEVKRIAANAITAQDGCNFKVTLVLDDSITPYGKFINEGTGTMPKRQFIGDSAALRKILGDRIKKHCNEIWRTS